MITRHWCTESIPGSVWSVGISCIWWQLLHVTQRPYEISDLISVRAYLPLIGHYMSWEPYGDVLTA